MTSTAEPGRPSARGAWLRLLLIGAALTMFCLQTPTPWSRLWALVPIGVAVSLVLSWRFGAWGVLVPLALFALDMVLEGPFSRWAWWAPVASLTGVWMGLREEGGGPTAGEKAWMLLPVLLLAAGMPWTMHYGDVVTRLDHELKASDGQIVTLGREIGYPAQRLVQLQQALADQADLRRQVLPHVLPTALFVWIAVLIAVGRSLAGSIAAILKWPPLSRAPLQNWRLPDGALWLLLAALTVLVAQWGAWAPTAWTLLLNAAIGYCVQGIAVVESLLLARGVPPSIITITMLFVFTLAMPVFMLTTAAVGLSDVWLDYRRLEPATDSESN